MNPQGNKALAAEEGGDTTIPGKGAVVSRIVSHCCYAIAVGALVPGMLLAQTAPTTPGPAKQQGEPVPVPTPTADPDGDKPIVSDKDFNAALPKLSDDINAPLEPLPQDAPFTPQTADKAPASATPAAPTPDIAAGTLPPPPEPSPELAQPLPPLDSYNTAPVIDVADTGDKKGAQLRYDTMINGLDPLGLDGQFRSFSALKKGGGKAANIPMVTARAREDEALAIRLMKSKGYYDASAVSVIETIPNDPGRVRAVVNAVPGNVYKLGTITIDAYPVTPSDLITKNLPLRTGDPIEADRIHGAEANVSLELGRTGYPFARIGTRDILLDEQAYTGDYTLPIDTGPRSSFGDITTTGKLAFGADHIRILRRFKPGELYDTRGIDDLRKALVATGLFSTVAVEPVDTGKDAPDGTRIVDIAVTQRVGKTRSVAATGGYSTGQGFRAEATYTARNAFPPEGALIVSAVGGTQERGAAVTFRRSNWRQRDRTLSFSLAAGRQDYDAFNALTTSLSGRVSYDSTPIWQDRKSVV